MPRKQNSPPKPIDSAAAIPRKGVATFVALVDPSGGGGGSSHRRTTKWDFSARLCAWRCNGGPLVLENLLVTDSAITDRTLSQRMKQYPTWAIVRFKARHEPGGGIWRDPHVEIEEFLGTADDSELDAIRQELQQPVTIKDRLFGDVTLERGPMWFRSEKFISTEGLGVTFNAETVDEARGLIDTAKPFWRDRRRWFKQFQEIVVEEWFPDRAGMYFRDHGVELTKREFLNMLGPPCAVTFWEADGDLGFEIAGGNDYLFGEHGVEVQGTLSGGLERSTY
ncbi:MAG: hypothetical protein JNG89_18805 [Planctomycetaceae bacterium]|nr:hypothetical protein [Planctomycetaceae bacterium]